MIEKGHTLARRNTVGPFSEATSQEQLNANIRGYLDRAKLVAQGTVSGSQASGIVFRTTEMMRAAEEQEDVYRCRTVHRCLGRGFWLSAMRRDAGMKEGKGGEPLAVSLSLSLSRYRVIAMLSQCYRRIHSVLTCLQNVITTEPCENLKVLLFREHTTN